MHTSMKELSPKFRSISLSTFKRHFIKESKMVYRVPKIIHAFSKAEKKKDCRWVTCSLLLQIFESNQELLFYDETTFNSEMRFVKTWFLEGQERVKVVKPPPATLS